MNYDYKVEFEDLKGKELVSIKKTKIDNQDAIIFETNSCDAYIMTHNQGCCENVYIEDICGDLNDLVGSIILVAEEVCSDNEPPLVDGDWTPDSYTWTFYKLSTNKGSVTIRWYGESNGYYSEGVDLYFVPAGSQEEDNEQDKFNKALKGKLI